MEILGLNPILAAALVVIVGILLRTWWGLSGKQIKTFDFNLFSKTIVLNVLTSLPITATAISVIPHDTEPLGQLLFIITQLGAVIGIDKGMKTLVPAIAKTNN